MLKIYEHKVDIGELMPDDYQLNVSKALQEVNERVSNYKPSKPGFLAKLFKSKDTTPPSKGLYLYGSVGCGKTMLMDLFYENCLVDKASKRRVHFHSFMLDVHASL